MHIITKYQIILLFGTISLLFACVSQKPIESTNYDKTKLYPISEHGKWGYTDESGQLIVAKQYESAELFHYGLARIKKNGKFGFITPSGEIHIAAKYDSASNFIGRISYVKKRNKTYAIDLQGKKTNYRYGYQAGCIGPRLCVALDSHTHYKNGKYAIIQSYYVLGGMSNYVEKKDTGQYIIDQVYSYSYNGILLEKDGLYGVYLINDYSRTNQSAIITHTQEPSNRIDSVLFKYDEVTLNHKNDDLSFKEKETISKTSFRIGNKWGVIDDNGREIIAAKYLNIEIINPTLAQVEYEPNKTGFINIIKNVEYF